MFWCTSSVPVRLPTVIGCVDAARTCGPSASTAAAAIEPSIHLFIMMLISSALMDAHELHVRQRRVLVEERTVDAERISARRRAREERLVVARRPRRARAGDARIGHRRRAVEAIAHVDAEAIAGRVRPERADLVAILEDEDLAGERQSDAEVDRVGVRVR